MATVKIKFRPSSVDGREGTVYYQDSRTCGKADQHLLQAVSCRMEQAAFPDCHRVIR